MPDPIDREMTHKTSAADRDWLWHLGNWTRPRDLAHFDQFRHYHETFYALCIGCGHLIKKTSMGFYANRLIGEDCAKKESV